MTFYKHLYRALAFGLGHVTALKYCLIIIIIIIIIIFLSINEKYRSMTLTLEKSKSAVLCDPQNFDPNFFVNDTR